ncbi:hypothetical protein VLK31_34955 [Variovorax sp. H27-G14]|uniref:hypothetical protein n=1 Tax=Variovorax sp. H27-G14 TaxID=3111914 RepID=UPI0038FC800A
MNQTVVPFQPGDATDRAGAVAHARAEAPKHEGARRALFNLQAACGDLPPVDCPLQHVFAPGMYLRTIFIPAGTFLVGKIHKHQHGNILSQGHVRVFTEGGGVKELHGPVTMVSAPGTKRAVFAVTDTVWSTIHLNPTNETDLAKIEADVIAPTYADYEQFLLGENAMTKSIEVAA